MSSFFPFQSETFFIQRPEPFNVIMACCVLGTLFYAVIYWAFKYALSPVLFGTAYKNLKENDKVEWDNRIMSTIHALVLAASASYVYNTEEQYYADWNTKHYSLPLAIVFLVSNGYFIVDTVMILMVRYKLVLSLLPYSRLEISVS